MPQRNVICPFSMTQISLSATAQDFERETLFFALHQQRRWVHTLQMYRCNFPKILKDPVKNKNCTCNLLSSFSDLQLCSLRWKLEAPRNHSEQQYLRLLHYSAFAVMADFFLLVYCMYRAKTQYRLQECLQEQEHWSIL